MSQATAAFTGLEARELETQPGRLTPAPLTSFLPRQATGAGRAGFQGAGVSLARTKRAADSTPALAGVELRAII